MSDKKRSYQQFCSVARALDEVGERWTLLIVRELLLGLWRYSDFLERLKGITTNLLAKRLANMEALGLIQKQAQSSVGSPHVYELTAAGRELEPVILALGRFGFRYMATGPLSNDQMDIGWGLLTLKLRYHGTNSGTLTLHLTSARSVILYQIRYSPEYVDIRHGQSWVSELVVEMALLDFRRMAFQGVKASLLQEEKKIQLQGRAENWQKFLKSFAFE
ncbi:MAG: helix-turn-helix transcriptional regulator [Gammaproteobacteria bacterium]|nr:helix-turn-helix transcriptional regulator [Gammaproteobacteria bacterium]